MRASGVGPAALLLPLAIGALTFVVLRGRPASRRPGDVPPPVAESDAAVAGWAGEAGAGEASPARLTASLRPLHHDPARQDFDAAVLRERLELPAGEPWRLDLRFAADPTAESATEPLAVRDFERIVVRDEAGTELRTLPREEGEALAVDPLRTLCAAPAAALRPGYEVTVLLWGPAPRGPLRLSGPSGGPFAATSELTLVPRHLPRDPTHESLARLER